MDPNLVLDFWLGACDDVLPSQERVSRWFAADADVDEAIRTGFGDLVERGLAGGLEGWEGDPRERVALVVLVDQFPRNLYRDDPRSFSGDSRALDLTRRSSAEELEILHPLERYFMLVPWMHAEDLDAQRAGEVAFARAAGSAPADFRPLLESGGQYAMNHRRVIERFGRFPHRNTILGRESTPEELAFVAEFGTGF